MNILLLCTPAMYDRCITAELAEQLAAYGSFRHLPCNQPSSWTEDVPVDPEVEDAVATQLGDVDVLLVGPGAPRLTARLIEAAPGLSFIGELEGDRFARRIDLEAARSAGVRVVDTSHGSSPPVAEWALALMMIGLRNAGATFRRLIDGRPAFADPADKYRDPGFLRGELTGKRVGLLACGHIGRRLLQLLQPFDVDVLVYDPYLSRELVDTLDVTVAPLETVLRESDVVVCLAPLTSETRHLIGAAELALLEPGAVFVNVSRGAVVNSAALVDRLAAGDLIACLDVFDPEPVPLDSPVRGMPNVFLSAHIAGVTAACGPRFVTLMMAELDRHLGGYDTRYDLVPRA